MVKALLSESEAQTIEASVARIEKRTATEVVVAVVDRSDDYWHFRVLIACGWALAFAIAALYFLPIAPVLAVALELPLALGIYFLSGLEPVYRWLIAPGAAERAVQARAFSLFAERGVHRTRDHTGLLLLVSALEHRVVILGDTGIYAMIGEQGFQDHVKHLVDRLREGHAAQGILETLERLETVLVQHIPGRTDDSNELPNALVRG
jgi:putative membrane protein